jgi:hypothetical protein
MIDRSGGPDCLAFLDAVNPFGLGSTAIILSLRLQDQSWQLVMDYHAGEMQVPRDHWLACMAENQGRCALGIYSGVSGKNQGKPTERELVMLYETRLLSMKDLGLPPLTFF